MHATLRMLGLASQDRASRNTARRSLQHSSPATRRTVRLDIIKDWQGLAALAQHWQDLAAAAQPSNIFSTWDYVATWWETFGADCALRVIVARDRDGGVAGIAPLIITAGDAGPRRLLRHLTFIGCSHEPVSQFMDFLVRRGRRDEIAPLFAACMFQELARDWDLIRLPLVEQQSAAGSAVSAAAQWIGEEVRQFDRETALFTRLPSSWDELVASRSKRFRANLRNAFNKLAAHTSAEVLVAGENIPFEEAYAAFVDLHRDRWGARSRAFLDVRSQLFMRRMAELLARQDRLLLVLVRIDGRYAAAGLEFIHDGTVFGIQGGWHEDFARLSVGHVALAQELQWCISRGLREFNFLAGDTFYKRCWMTGSREIVGLEIANPTSLRAKVFCWLREHKQHLRALRDTRQPAK